jgi:hypothetical protein
LVRMGEYVADHGMEGEGDHRAVRDLLMAVAPRVRGQEMLVDGEATLAAAVRIARNLDRRVFPVQGPPGAGKTYTGARMICALAREGKTVGITANSHKVIRNLLDEVVVAAREQGAADRLTSMYRMRYSRARLPCLRSLDFTASVHQLELRRDFPSRLTVSKLDADARCGTHHDRIVFDLANRADITGLCFRTLLASD